jgi:hypothetical protein
VLVRVLFGTSLQPSWQGNCLTGEPQISADGVGAAQTTVHNRHVLKQCLLSLDFIDSGWWLAAAVLAFN